MISLDFLFKKMALRMLITHLTISSILFTTLVNAIEDKEEPEPKHTKSKNHPNAKPLSFWESREMFMKGHDKSEAKILIILIAIFGMILTLIMIIIALVCWKESVKDREERENA